MKVIHLPVIIANNSVVLSKYLNRIGVDSKTISYFRTWLNYEADISIDLDKLNGDQRQEKLAGFVDDFMKHEAKKYDIFHFHFLGTLASGSSFGGWNAFPERGPAWDLEALKRMGKKIVFYCVGSEIRNNSKIIYNQLKFLLPELDIPAPPLNRLEQYQKIWLLTKYADALVCGDSETQPHLPFSKMILHPIDLEPLDSRQKDNPGLEKISLLHAPSNNLYKGTDIVHPVMEKIKSEYTDRVEIRLIQNVAHDKALELYRGHGPAIDQINMSFGLFALEAMAFGRPVICSVRPGTFSPDDPKASAPIWSVLTMQELETALREYIDGRRDYDPESMRTYVREHHGGEALARQWKDLYQSLLDGERQYFYISQKWYEEFDRVIRGQVVDQAGYYHLASDILLANRNVNRLLHECQMAQGLYDNFEMSAKALAALNMAGQRERAGQIKAQLDLAKLR
ncbi:MAG: hypothetical protein JRF41_03475 [Deltaproteobacteria bacterium]|nr:hypothetical protein [Deltaproteobacteria bacterium]